ncbi:MAG TPA: hypothetical protein VFU32_09365 [Ktedonobacterales bacterium]|nr:hypothetical protein [Ktedonobacterales bacterium]
MGLLRRLWHRLLFGSSPVPAPAAPPRPAAPAARPPAAPPRPAVRPPVARSASPFTAADVAALQWVKASPPSRFVYRSRQEVELALLMPWLPDAERGRFLALLLPRAGKYQPWTRKFVKKELWQQIRQWEEPVVIKEPETMTIEDFRCLLEAELANGLSTFCTPLDLLSRPVRMLWLLRQGRRAGQVYALLEQAAGNRAQALYSAWWVVDGL